MTGAEVLAGGGSRAAAGARPRRSWLRVAAATAAVAWGGNQFTPLLLVYRADGAMTTWAVDMLLGAYVLGIVPALLVGGPLSDRFGRRPLVLPAPWIAAAASVVLALAHGQEALLLAGRVLSGVALGLVMGAGAAWMTELSAPPHAGARAGAGARRTSLSLTFGFGAGAAVAAALAQFAPRPEVVPYSADIVLAALAGLRLLPVPETRVGIPAGSPLADLRRTLRSRRFRRVVAPMAPWVFGTATSAYAVLPNLVAPRAPGFEVGLAGALCLVALGCGFAVQPLARRLGGLVRGGTVIATGSTAVVGFVLAAVAAGDLALPLVVASAAVLGASYGLCMVSGLLEVQASAAPDELAGASALFYSCSYLGFFLPALLAAFAGVGYPVLFTVLAVLVAVCSTAVVLAMRRGEEPAGSRLERHGGGA